MDLKSEQHGPLQMEPGELIEHIRQVRNRRRSITISRPKAPRKPVAVKKKALNKLSTEELTNLLALANKKETPS